MGVGLTYGRCKASLLNFENDIAKARIGFCVDVCYNCRIVMAEQHATAIILYIQIWRQAVRLSYSNKKGTWIFWTEGEIMKDIISVLQSRIDKRAKVLAQFQNNAVANNIIVPLQKLDKQLMAEIISLRRQLKEKDEICNKLLRREDN